MVDKGEAWDELPPTTFWGGAWVSHIPHHRHPLCGHGAQCRFCKVSQYISKVNIPRHLMDRHRNPAWGRPPPHDVARSNESHEGEEGSGGGYSARQETTGRLEGVLGVQAQALEYEEVPEDTGKGEGQRRQEGGVDVWVTGGGEAVLQL